VLLLNENESLMRNPSFRYLNEERLDAYSANYLNPVTIDYDEKSYKRD